MSENEQSKPKQKNGERTLSSRGGEVGEAEMQLK